MLNLYTETACDIKPSIPASLIRIGLPPKHGVNRKSRASPTSSFNGKYFPKDQETFTRQCLATQGSIYCRHTKKYPRTFLWRVLDDGYTLEVQCADLARSSTDLKEAHLTLSLEFQNPILPSGVAFSDADNGDTLYAFVVTAGKKELYALELHTDFFRSSAAIPEDVLQWCHLEILSSFTIDQPHALSASTPFELFISFESGRLQKVTRRSEDFDWVQENYDDKTWGASIRGIVGRRGPRAIQYQSRSIEPTTAHAMLASSDSTYVFTICLNHTLRVWNLATGKLAVTKDLLDKSRQPQDHIQMNPAEASHLQLIKLERLSNPVLLTYSPFDGGQFKFWDVKGGLTSPLVVEDKYPGVKLSAPDPDPTGNTVWSMIGVQVRPGDFSRRTELWILWRNNNHHQLYSLDFDFSDLIELWGSAWVKTAIAPSVRHTAPDLVKYDSQDVTSKWLQFLFLPGRYSTSVLETALGIYQDALSIKLPASQRSRSLKERMCHVVASNATLMKISDSDINYERFITEIDGKWRNFWRVVESLNEGRHAPISLSLDVFADMTWIMMTDQCCAVRECSDIELLQLNSTENLEGLEARASERWPHRKVSAEEGEPLTTRSALIQTAATFRKSFSAELMRDVEIAVEEELLMEPEETVPFRITDLYERVNFGDAISNEMYDQVEKDISQIGGISGLSNEFFMSVLDTLPVKTDKPESALRSTVFASNLLSAGMQDTIVATRQLLFDLLVLVVFLEGETNQEEARPVEFDASELFSQIISFLREYDKNLWLVSNSRLAPLEFLGPNPAPNALRSGDQNSWQTMRVVTILEDSIGKAVKPQPVVDKPLMYYLTDLLGEIEAWIGGNDEIAPEDGLVYVQCDLIAQGNLELAREFRRFQPRTAWATYIKARLCLAQSDHSNAAVYFERAAYTMACGKAVGSLNEMSAGLITVMELDYFNSGLPRYFQHIMALFEAAKAYSYAAKFARLALQSLSSTHKEPVPHFRSEILSRLFTAEMQGSDFGAAYDALIQFSDLALQKSSVISLATAILDPKNSISGTLGAIQMLQSLPLGLHPHLAKHVDQHLYALAKKQSFVPDSSFRGMSTSSNDYLEILHTMRVSQGDYRGAVAVLFDRLRLIRRSSRARSDPQATELRHALLALINALSCVAQDEAYILADMDDPARMSAPTQDPPSNDGKEKSGRKKRKRIIVTLDDLRKEYQDVLDRCSRIERGDFDFDMDGESDEGDVEDGFHGPGNSTNGDAMEM